MKLTLLKDAQGNPHTLIARREDGDPRFRTGWDGVSTTESQFFYHLKLALNKTTDPDLLPPHHRAGREPRWDLIKKRMQADGHVFGHERLPYLRSRTRTRGPVWAIYDGEYAVRDSGGDFNAGRVTTF